MTQYNTLNVKVSNSQIIKLRPGKKLFWKNLKKHL